MTQHKYKRKKKLILPGLQMKLVAGFLATAGVAVLVQSVMLVYALTSLAKQAPHDMLIIMDRIPGITGTVILLSFGVTVLLTAYTGILITFRIAGPLYRFEQYLKQVIAGERPPDCKLRKDDELMHLCELINQATAPLRTPLPAPQTEVTQAGLAQAAASPAATALPEPPPALPSAVAQPEAAVQKSARAS